MCGERGAVVSPLKRPLLRQQEVLFRTLLGEIVNSLTLTSNTHSCGAMKPVQCTVLEMSSCNTQHIVDAQ